MSYQLYEFDNGKQFGPASDEDAAAYTKALQEGKQYITRGYHGYTLKMVVRNVRSIEEEQKLYGVSKE